MFYFTSTNRMQDRNKHLMSLFILLSFIYLFIYLFIIYLALTSTITSKSVPNTGVACLIDSFRFSVCVSSLVGSMDWRPAFLYTSLSIIEPKENMLIFKYNNLKHNLSRCLWEDFCCVINCFNFSVSLCASIYPDLRGICNGRWHPLYHCHKHFWYWCIFPHSFGPLWSVTMKNNFYDVIYILNFSLSPERHSSQGLIPSSVGHLAG